MFKFIVSNGGCLDCSLKISRDASQSELVAQLKLYFGKSPFDR